MKHDNYNNTAEITITKCGDPFEGDFILKYYGDGEEWEYHASKEEILEELSEHMDNMGEEKE